MPTTHIDIKVEAAAQTRITDCDARGGGGGGDAHASSVRVGIRSGNARAATEKEDVPVACTRPVAPPRQDIRVRVLRRPGFPQTGRRSSLLVELLLPRLLGCRQSTLVRATAADFCPSLADTRIDVP